MYVYVVEYLDRALEKRWVGDVCMTYEIAERMAEEITMPELNQYWRARGEDDRFAYRIEKKPFVTEIKE